MTARRQRRHQLDNKGAAIWTVTFCDLLTLLFSAFVLRFSMSTFDIESFKAQPKPLALKAEISPGLQLLQKLVTELEVALGAPIPNDQPSDLIEFPGEVVLEAKRFGVLIALRGGNFLSGSDEPSLTARAVLSQLSEVFSRLDLDVEIAGHTDSNAIQSEKFPSNWELSTARAVAVAEILLANGLPGNRLSAVGYSDTHPRATNDTDEGRYENRRVELFVRSEHLTTVEAVDGNIAPPQHFTHPEAPLSQGPST